MWAQTCFYAANPLDNVPESAFFNRKSMRFFAFVCGVLVCVCVVRCAFAADLASLSLSHCWPQYMVLMIGGSVVLIYFSLRSFDDLQSQTALNDWASAWGIVSGVLGLIAAFGSFRSLRLYFKVINQSMHRSPQTVDRIDHEDEYI